MHVILVTVGTDGDVFPYIGLGTKLRARGSEVTLVASAQYETFARASGLAFRALVSVEENQALFGHPEFWNPLKTMPLMARWGARFIPRQYELLSGLLGENTLLVANPGVLPVALVHEKAGIPWVSMILQPWVIPSSLAPPVMPGFTFLRRAPRPVWKLFWRALDVVVDGLLAHRLNGFRASLGLKPARRIFHNWLSPQLVLGLFPEWYGPPQADWPPQIRLTGFPMFDGGQDNELCPQVLDFCRAGTPPVAFTFGTGMAHPAELFRGALEACARLGVRGIFLTKYREQLPGPLPSTVLVSTFAPFQKLFPHCAAVVHHGGIGTVAKALAAGTPQLICPLCFDQLDNSVRIQQLGAGDWLKSKHYDGRQVADALVRLMTPAMQARCRELSARFAHVNALEATAEALELFATGRLVAAGLPRKA